MLYLKNADGLPELVELFARFQAEVPSLACPSLRSTSRLQARPAILHPVRDKSNEVLSLAFDAETASWCFLSEEETNLWSMLKQGLTYQTLRQKADGWRASQLRDFLTHLYQRGLLVLNGKPGLDPKIYARGPLFGRAYLVEILLTERCNLACRYCYAQGAPDRAVMPMSTLRRTVDLAMTLPAGFLTFQFAGGETLTHFSAFKRAVAYIEKAADRSHKEAEILVQSNGTLLSRPGVVDFLRGHDIRVGVSLEGPREINDLTRNYIDGRSSHRDTLKGLEAVRKGGLTVVGTLTVIGRHNADRALDLLEFFTKLGVVGVRFNVIIAKGRGTENWDELGITPREYFEFMKKVIQYIGRTRAFQEANLQQLVRNLVMRTRNFRCMRSPCGAGFDYLVITPEGDIYPCVHWLREARLHLGNVHDFESLEWAFLHSPAVKEMADRIVDHVAECRRCEWRHLCEGGCALRAKDRYGKLLAPDPLCEYYRNIYPFLFDYLSKDPEFATFLVPEAEVCRMDVNGSRDRHDLARGSMAKTSC